MQIIILINYLPFKQSNETLLLGSFKRNLDFLISWFWSLYLTKPRWHVKVTLSSMLCQATSDDNISLRKKHFFFKYNENKRCFVENKHSKNSSAFNVLKI